MTFLRLLWTVRGPCQHWRQRVMARLKMQQATEKIRLNTVEDTFTHQWGLISLIYFFLTFVTADTVLSYGLAKHRKGKPFFPSCPVRLEGSDSEKVALFTSLLLAAAVSEQWVHACAPSQVSVEIVSEIWREERACLYLPTPMSHSAEWAIWTGPQWTEQTGREWWHFIFFLTKKESLLCCCY